VAWIYLSPHFDDAALSCGGLIWDQSSGGGIVQVWTICAGSPGNSLSPFAQQLHQRWQTGTQAVGQRQAEDERANEILQAEAHYFPFLDCIYRQDSAGRFLYASEESLFGELDPAEGPLVHRLAEHLAERAAGLAGDAELNVVAPLALGGHVDHRLARRAAEAWARQNPRLRLWLYQDYPYVVQHPSALPEALDSSWQKQVYPVSGPGLEKWCAAVGAHASQISTFWSDPQAMCQAIRAYHAQFGGLPLYRVS
jgi:LmbE family N-acetylglucosaminyl deacetylase